MNVDDILAEAAAAVNTPPDRSLLAPQALADILKPILADVLHGILDPDSRAASAARMLALLTVNCERLAQEPPWTRWQALYRGPLERLHLNPPVRWTAATAARKGAEARRRRSAVAAGPLHGAGADPAASAGHA